LIFKLCILETYASDDDGMFKYNCMPACTEITYGVETSQATFDWKEDMKEYFKATGLDDTLIPE
jgi:hypothetical protein